ncbi:histidine kinase dimerization/phosphoacceptor domain -containing protein [Agrobacterium rosae]|uniref:Histidine kinase dimerization/phosphoacceptor domain -containing protein n=1 Tax=Agrobacterium rosae TaxID=1972867 RepID=A0ABU4W473_9HYPH|nr:histidine kinase dimerization/phosphoacceptor domain -containing protein [Agrobacterium rosae]MDX8332555.1 histidine kinase dimerization/phosphoacceptor domain -containing protein [Agrobacterium rosae]
MEQKYDWELTDRLHTEHGRGDPFAAAVRATRMPMVVTDPDQQDNPIVFVNEAFQLMTGYSRDECIGRNCRFLQGPKTDQQTISKIRNAVERGEDVAVDILNYRKDGTTFWNALYLSPVRGGNGDIQFFFASQLDVTNRVNAQQRVVDQKEQVEHEVKVRTSDLEASVEAQALLLHEVDHRVKNNLSVIGSLLRMQIRDSDDPNVRRALRSTMERVDAMAAVHRRLYQADDVRYFEVSSYAANIIQDAISASRYKDVFLHSEVQTVRLPSELATSFGLLLNEILLHLFDPYTPIKSVSLRSSIDDETIRIVISNEVVEKTPQDAISPLSLKLISRLSSQLGATVDWVHSLDGLAATLTIQVSAP